jgi:hypothetical protein
MRWSKAHLLEGDWSYVRRSFKWPTRTGNEGKFGSVLVVNDTTGESRAIEVPPLFVEVINEESRRAMEELRQEFRRLLGVE